MAHLQQANPQAQRRLHRRVLLEICWRPCIVLLMALTRQKTRIPQQLLQRSQISTSSHRKICFTRVIFLWAPLNKQTLHRLTILCSNHLAKLGLQTFHRWIFLWRKRNQKCTSWPTKNPPQKRSTKFLQKLTKIKSREWIKFSKFLNKLCNLAIKRAIWLVESSNLRFKINITAQAKKSAKHQKLDKRINRNLQIKIVASKLSVWIWVK